MIVIAWLLVLCCAAGLFLFLGGGMGGSGTAAWIGMALMGIGASGLASIGAVENEIAARKSRRSR